VKNIKIDLPFVLVPPIPILLKRKDGWQSC
jgi:hypothetical protein